MAIIAPSLLAADFADLNKEVAGVIKGGCQLLHLDVMDGHFVPNLTMGPDLIRSLRKRFKIPFDIHLMIEEPERYLEAFYQADQGDKDGQSIISVHWEACPHIRQVLGQIKQLDSSILAGCVLNPDTPVSVLEDVWDALDMVLIMSVYPGFGGQKAIDSCFDKVAALRKMEETSGKKVLIEIDGGIHRGNMMKAAEADILVMGTAVFGTPQPEQAIAEMQQILSAK